MSAVYNLGLTGFPLEHSLSPEIHNAALQAAGLSGTYRLYPARPGTSELADLVARVRLGELSGLNVTIPHKQAVLPLVDELTPTAQAVGAVNTLYLSAGKLVGHNTDVDGFWLDVQARLSIGQSLPYGQALSNGQALPGGEALLLGAGGSARAAGFALLRAGWQVTICARRRMQAEILQKELNRAMGSPAHERVFVLAWEERTHISSTCTLLVNSTPLGMLPHPHGSPWPADFPLPVSAAIYDLVYNPPVTALLAQAGAAGRPAANGLGMLVEQAALSFECWTGGAANRKAMTSAAQTALDARMHP